MFHVLTSFADAQRQAATGRVVEERAPLKRFPRLLESLAADTGEIEYRVGFTPDFGGRPRLHVTARGAVQLICQRTLEAFAYPLEIDAWLGVIAREEDEAELLAEHEPLLLDGSEERSLDSIVEDELILALPAFPVAPGSEGRAPVWQEDMQQKEHPFAALSGLQGNPQGNKAR